MGRKAALKLLLMKEYCNLQLLIYVQAEKSVEAALKKLLDEGYVIKHGSGKNTFYSKAF